jgi:hypothetical protein
MEVTCGVNKAILLVNRLGGKNKCILFDNALMTPNEFQTVSGLEHVKNWLKSIKHNGRSLHVLTTSGKLQTESDAATSADRLEGMLSRKAGLLQSKNIVDGQHYKRMVLCDEQAYKQFLNVDRPVIKQTKTTNSKGVTAQRCINKQSKKFKWSRL